ncbi:hypothetical protein [Streptomyces sp. ISL-94]|nr:hypothetical protein [Streptomyces sp. ISL-94]
MSHDIEELGTPAGIGVAGIAVYELDSADRAGSWAGSCSGPS